MAKKSTFSLSCLTVLLALSIHPLSHATPADCSDYVAQNAAYKQSLKDQATNDPERASLSKAREVKRNCMMNISGTMGELTAAPNGGTSFVSQIMNKMTSAIDSAGCNAVTAASNSALRKADSTLGGMTGGATNGMLSNAVSGVASGDPLINTDSVINKGISNATSKASNATGSALQSVTGGSTNSFTSPITSSLTQGAQSGINSTGSSLQAPSSGGTSASSIADTWTNVFSSN